MAARFWVGGSGTWDNSSTANWSATSGGAPGASAPTTADTATFDANSGTAAVVTVAATATASSTTINKSDITLILSGSPTLAIATGALILTTGTLDLASNTLTISRFSSATTSTRTLAFGASGKIIINGGNTGANLLVWNTTTGASTLTVTGSRDVEMTLAATTGTRQFAAGNVGETKAWNLKVTAGTDIIAIQNHINNFDLTGFAGTFANDDRTFYGNVTFVTGVTYSAGSVSTKFSATTGTQLLTINGTTHDYPVAKDGAGALQLQDNLTMGSTRTFTLTAGTLDLNNLTLSAGRFNCSTSSTTRSVAFGTGNITLTDFNATILLWGNSNLTATGSKNIFATYAGATGTRTFSMNATGAVESNVPNILITAGTDTVASFSRVRTLDFTGFKGTYNSATSKTIFGGLIFDPGMTITGSTNGHEFSATTGPFIVKTAGLVMDFPITFSGTAIGGIFEFDDAITMGAGRTLAVNAGTVKFKAGTTNTSGTFAFVGTSAPGRQLFIQSTTPGTQYTLSQSNGTVTAQFATLQDSNAIGGATWNAFVDQGNIDAGNNDGWDFGISPIVGSYEYTYQLRSFTQPRRF